MLVFVLFDPELPIQKNSKLDISLLRAAHQALMRQQNGIIDCFLFVICGNSNEQDIAKFFVPYNFPQWCPVSFLYALKNGKKMKKHELFA